MEFKEYSLLDCLHDIIDYRGKTPKKLGLDWVDEGPYRAISAKNIKKNELVNIGHMKNASENLYFKWMTKEIEKGDILLTSEAPLGESLYWDSDEKLILSQRIFCLKPNNKIIYSKFLFAQMQSRFFLHQLESRQSGTTVTGIRRKELEKVTILVPDYNSQKAIGDFYYNLNEKIKINSKIIANLEELSQTLFKRWFVDFEFPDENGNPYKSSGGSIVQSNIGDIPTTWSTYYLGDYINLQKGLSYKGKYLDKDHEREDSFPLISLSNFNFYKGFKDVKTKYYFGDFKERHLVYHGDLIIAATDLTQDRKILGSPAIVPKLHQKMIYSLDVFRVTATKLPINFLYFLLQTQSYRSKVEGSATGTTVVRISQKLLESIELNLPKNQNLINDFNEIITPYINKMEILKEESKQLSELRDTLLPKLMSGEIELPDELEVDEHADLLQ